MRLHCKGEASEWNGHRLTLWMQDRRDLQCHCKAALSVLSWSSSGIPLVSHNTTTLGAGAWKIWFPS